MEVCKRCWVQVLLKVRDGEPQVVHIIIPEPLHK